VTRRASQELGGTALFARRLGFSGTPSALLPEELGACVYQANAKKSRNDVSWTKLISLLLVALAPVCFGQVL
jgi:hypothetical protein